MASPKVPSLLNRGQAQQPHGPKHTNCGIAVRYSVGFALNLFSAKLHGERPPWVGFGASTTPSYQLRGRFFHKEERFLRYFSGCHSWWGPAAEGEAARKPTAWAFGGYRLRTFCNWRV